MVWVGCMQRVRIFWLRGKRVFAGVYIRRAHAVGSLWGQDVVCRFGHVSFESWRRDDKHHDDSMRTTTLTATTTLAMTTLPMR